MGKKNRAVIKIGENLETNISNYGASQDSKHISLCHYFITHYSIIPDNSSWYLLIRTKKEQPSESNI